MASGVAATPDGKTILVADRDDNAVSIIDAASFTRVATLPVGTHPFGVTIDAAGARAYTANVESDDVSVIDIAARKVVGRLATESRPYTVALAIGRIFVANQHADSVSVFDAASLAPAGVVKVGEYPEGIAASGDETRVFVANWFSNELWAIDAKSLTVVGKASTGDGPRAFGAFVAATR
jgi:YVTN family beta-propeller protein